MKTVRGDLIKLAKKGEFDVIAHGCNCFCTMGAGIAKTIKQKFPEAYAADCRTQKGSREKLGTCTYAQVKGNRYDLTIVNAYTQHHYRGRHNIDYEALRACMKAIKDKYAGKRIGLPKIGAGLAGGSWKLISSIIEEELAGEDVTIVEYSG